MWSINTSVARIIILIVLGFLFYTVVARRSSYEPPFQSPASTALWEIRDDERTPGSPQCHLRHSEERPEIVGEPVPAEHHLAYPRQLDGSLPGACFSIPQLTRLCLGHIRPPMVSLSQVERGTYRPTEPSSPRRSIRPNTSRSGPFLGFGKWTENEHKPLVCVSVTGFWETGCFAYAEAGASGGIRKAENPPEPSRVSWHPSIHPNFWKQAL